LSIHKRGPLPPAHVQVNRGGKVAIGEGERLSTHVKGQRVLSKAPLFQSQEKGHGGKEHQTAGHPGGRTKGRERRKGSVTSRTGQPAPSCLLPARGGLSDCTERSIWEKTTPQSAGKEKGLFLSKGGGRRLTLTRSRMYSHISMWERPLVVSPSS